MSVVFAAVEILLMLGAMPIAFAIAAIWGVSHVDDVRSIMLLIGMGGMGCAAMSGCLVLGGGRKRECQPTSTKGC